MNGGVRPGALETRSVETRALETRTFETRTFETMGTVVSLRLRRDTGGTGDGGDDLLAGVRRDFQTYDDIFSLYRPDSELSRIASGSLSLTASSSTVRGSYSAAIDWRIQTGGDFTPHRPDGVIDLSGIVKAQAMRAAATHLDDISPAGWLMNVGGDVVGSRECLGEWSIGIVDPGNRAELLCQVQLRPGWSAVATSGTAERGEHIWRTDRAREFTQVTVLADDIVMADVLATAVLAGGRAQLDRATRDHDIDVLAVTGADEILATPRLTDAIRSH